MVQFLSINFFFLDFFNFCWVFQKFPFFCVNLYVYNQSGVRSHARRIDKFCSCWQRERVYRCERCCLKTPVFNAVCFIGALFETGSADRLAAALIRQELLHDTPIMAAGKSL